MVCSRWFRILTVAVGIVILWASSASPQTYLAESERPLEDIEGGVWRDDFINPQLVEGKNIDVQMSHLMLKFNEQLHWVQTWTAHFANGEFYHTETISDSVRLAPSGLGQYYTTGIFTSTVLYAGKAVDWALAEWGYSGLSDAVKVEFRTGNTDNPDNSWSSWKEPNIIMFEYYCDYTFNSEATECLSNMSGIDSSAYIQYRATFNSNDANKTVALDDMDITYGTHALTGTASSMIIPPVDLRAWESIILTSTVPSGTALTVDVFGADGSLLAEEVENGESLAGIDPVMHPALILRANMLTSDASLTPDIDLWGVRWLTLNRIYIPVISR